MTDENKQPESQGDNIDLGGINVNAPNVQSNVVVKGNMDATQNIAGETKPTIQQIIDEHLPAFPEGTKLPEGTAPDIAKEFDNDANKLRAHIVEKAVAEAEIKDPVETAEIKAEAQSLTAKCMALAPLGLKVLSKVGMAVLADLGPARPAISGLKALFSAIQENTQ